MGNEMPAHAVSPGVRLVSALLAFVAAAGVTLAADQRAQSANGESPGWRSVVDKFAQEHFHNPAWGYSHCQRDYQLAVELAAADHVKLDDDVLYAAAYLHDMAAFEPWQKSGVDHADQAAEIVDTILKNTGFPMKKIARVGGTVGSNV